jgi:primary-amine oxidase
MTLVAQHPLDPLDADEFRRVVDVVARECGVGDGWRYASIELREPAKQEVLAFRPGDPISRSAMAICWNRADGAAYRAVVSLALDSRTSDTLTSWEHLPGVHPNLTVDEWHECDDFLRADPQLIAALKRRGITDLSLVLVDVWAYGAALVPERYRGLRIGWADVWVRSTPNGNPYANPVGGLHPIVDLNRMTLLEIEDDAREPNVGRTGEAAPARPAAVRGEY